MKQRRALLIIGGVVVALVAVLVVLSIYFHRSMELEMNRRKTASARKVRWQDDPKETLPAAGGESESSAAGTPEETEKPEVNETTT